MAKPLPLKLWIGLEDDVARHKAEVAQGFAEARARLLPESDRRLEQRPWTTEELAQIQGNTLTTHLWKQSDLRPVGPQDYQGAFMHAYQNAHSPLWAGLMGL